MANQPLVKQPVVYMMASGKNGTLYLGVTMNLRERLWQHKNGIIPDSFSSRYGVKKLVWYECFESMPVAIAREKALKKWRREWKIRLIEEDNPDWLDLSHTVMAG
ncbi:GIY-YIG nuclease family protein [Neisseria sp. CCUG17229]|uniref:GIY-YIG nuclease family protein n=1 Tax=Neisseria sp. CCUG17229 TaxID=3392036 RepID=UPI003A0FD895